MVEIPMWSFIVYLVCFIGVTIVALHQTMRVKTLRELLGNIETEFNMYLEILKRGKDDEKTNK